MGKKERNFIGQTLLETSIVFVSVKRNNSDKGLALC